MNHNRYIQRCCLATFDVNYEQPLGHSLHNGGGRGGGGGGGGGGGVLHLFVVIMMFMNQIHRVKQHISRAHQHSLVIQHYWVHYTVP